MPYSLWDLSSPIRHSNGPSAVKALSPDHWTAEKFREASLKCPGEKEKARSCP